MLWKAASRLGQNLCYQDTDSLVFVMPPEDSAEAIAKSDIPEVDSLGQLGG